MGNESPLREGFDLDYTCPVNSLLVTGLPGVPGWNLYHWFRSRWPGPVVGIYPPGNAKAAAPGSVPIDAVDVDSLTQLFREHRFTAVVDASGNCALKACECDPALSDLLNTHFGCQVALLAREYGARLVRLSSDLVFSGDESHTPPYLEEEVPDPVSNYGKSTAEAERRIAAIKTDCHILRVPLPMGYTPGGHAGAIDWIEWRFRNGRPATLFFDEVRNPIHCDDLNRIVEWILYEKNFPPGIYHCGGPYRISLYQIAQVINAVGMYAPELLHGCPRHDAGPMPPRAGNVSLDSGKLLRFLPSHLRPRPWPIDPRLRPNGLEWHSLVDRNRWNCTHQITKLLVLGEFLST
ncbi:MAG TPA: sugar nucleotide-binding protein [Fibrobacteraceae bacterium]|nr:sugar nucleotide-binding protein [Fibrobacteraceae bacterium]